MAVTLNANTSTGFIATSDTSGVLQLQTAGTTAVTVDASQRVGIGTASPATKVDNTGSFRSTGVTDPVSGAGLELCYRGTVADVLSYNRDTSQFTELQVRGSPIAFYNAGGERARIPATGGIQSVSSISVGNTAPTTSGAGITFPATQSASSDVNTLDDYEEGTFTPTLGGTSTYAQQAGNYKKVGGLVYVSGILQVTTLGTGSTSQMSGFPFTCSVGPRNTLAIGYWSGTVGSLAYLAFYVPAGSASTNTIATTAVASTVQDGYGVFQNGTYVIFSGCYHAS